MSPIVGGIVACLTYGAMVLMIQMYLGRDKECHAERDSCRLCPPCANCGRQEACPYCYGSMCTEHPGEKP